MFKKPDVAVRFMTAWLRGARFYCEGLLNGHLRGKNAPHVIDILTRSTPITNREIYSGMVSHVVDPDGRVNVTTLSDDFAFYKSGGFITGNVTVPQAIDMQYQLAALKVVGKYRHPY